MSGAHTQALPTEIVRAAVDSVAYLKQAGVIESKPDQETSPAVTHRQRQPTDWYVRRGMGGSQYFHIASDERERIAVVAREEDANRITQCVNNFDALRAKLTGSLSVNKLKPCPFCGGTDIHPVEGGTPRWAYLECRDCGGNKGDVRKSDAAKPAAHPENIEALALDWNDRPSERAIAAATGLDRAMSGGAL